MISTPTVARDSAGPKATRNELASGAHTAVQQDDRQREVTHHIGERVIIEGDTADSVDSRQHADSRKMTRIGMPRRDENELNKMLKVTGDGTQNEKTDYRCGTQCRLTPTSM